MVSFKKKERKKKIKAIYPSVVFTEAFAGDTFLIFSVMI
jgi:hypothetical protein